MDENLLLQWLSQADSSAYGECRGPELDKLISKGLAQVEERPSGNIDDYSRVKITPLGLVKLSTQTVRPT
jgi:hypothetical protein